MEIKVDDTTIFADTGGRPFDPALPAVLFLHGAGMDRTVWALQSRYLAHHGCTVLAIDLPGHGRSGGEAAATIGDAADWLLRCLDAVGLERVALVGHSMGALIALDFAGRYPARLRALALLGVAAAMPVHPDLLAAAEGNDALAFRLITSWGHGAVGHYGGAKVPGAWLLGAGGRLLERVRPGVLHRDMVACNDYRAAPERAAAATCPALLILGADDMMTPAKAGRKLAAAFADARVEVIAGCGHMMMVEKPDETLAALKGFVI